VLVAVDGTPLESPRDLQRVVSSTPVGKRVRVVLLREGRETEVEVTIGLYKERETRERDAPAKPNEPPKDSPKDAPKDSPKDP
jgi:serine protease Do